MDNNNITVSVYYNDNGDNIVELLKQSLWFYIEEEIKKLCQAS